MPRLSSSWRRLRASAMVTSFSKSVGLRVSPRSSPPWLASITAKYRCETGEGPPATELLAGAGGVGGATTVCADAGDVGEIVAVRPSALKLAIKGTGELTVIAAPPLVSAYVAEGMTLLPNVRVGRAGATKGSRLKVMRNAPSSVATVGYIGVVKWNTSLGGLSPASDAVKWVAMLPMKRRSESSCTVTGPPRKRGNREASDETGTRPRSFSSRKRAGNSAS